MEGVSQAVALALTAALCAAVIKRQTPDLSLTLALCAVTLILGLAMGRLSPIRAMLESLSEKAGLSGMVLTPVLKTVGISLLTRVAADLCRDAEEKGLAAAVEIAGSVSALTVCLPLFEAVLRLATDLL